MAATRSGIPVLRQFYGSRQQDSRRTAPVREDGPAPRPAFAFLADTGRAEPTAQGVFPLAGGVYSAGGFRSAGGWVRVEEPGSYLALFTVSGEAGPGPLPAVFLIRGDGAAAGEPARLLRDADGTVQGVGSAVISLRAGEGVALAAAGPLAVTGTPAVTLMLLREI